LESSALVDTSAWIDFFRRKDPCFTLVSKLMSDDAVLILPLIVAELIQGARTKSEIRELKELLTVFPVLQESEQTWPQAGELAFQLKQSGIHPGLADCFIAVMCMHHSVPLLTLDKHFEQIKAKTSLRSF